MSTIQKGVIGGLFLLVLGLLTLGLFPSGWGWLSMKRQVPHFKLNVLGQPNVVWTQEALQNRLTVLHVWSTWCQACHHEHSLWLSLAKQSKPYFVGLNFYDDPTEARQYLAEQGDPFLLHLSDEEGQLGIDLGIYGTPETFLIDSEGRISEHHVGPMTLEIWQKRFLPIISSYERNHDDS